MSAVAMPKRDLAILFLVVATELIGFGLVIPILPQLGLQLQVSYLWLGVLMGAYSAAQFVAAPILGALSDRYGRKPILILSKLGTILGYAILAVSHNYALFMLSRLIDGFTGGNISVARAYVADITTSVNRARGMAVIGMAFGVGFILGPALGGFLFGLPHGQFWAAVVAGSLSALALVFTALFLKEPETRTVTTSPLYQLKAGFNVIRAPWVAGILLIQWLYMIVFSGFETTFSVFTHYTFLLDTRQNSWLFVVAGLFTLVVQGTIVRKKHFNPKRMLVFGLAALASAFGLLASVQQMSVLFLALAMLALGIGMVTTYLPSLLSTMIPEGLQGAVMGAYEGIGSLSRVIGPVVAFSIFVVSPTTCYMVFSTVLAIVGLVVLLRFNPQK